jgi:phosphoribosylformylglycinamidine cyclo-ligase
VAPRDRDAVDAYAEAGVDVAAGDRAVGLIREELATRRAGGGPALSDLLGGLGGFAAAVPIPAGMRDPVLVCATDGVGTKTEIARQLNRRDTIGRDLVAMCADDVACHGAMPYLFLDYVAVGRVEPESIAELVRGVASGCEDACCSLVGGETAEHPGLMAPDAFDLAGFCVGVAERTDLLDGRTAKAGDAVIGIASSGLHANGYSLVRLLIERHRLDLAMGFGALVEATLGGAAAARLGAEEPALATSTLGDVLLNPTRIYSRDVLELRTTLRADGLRLSGLAHVTGGGLRGNLPRAVGSDLGVSVSPGSWPLPAIFRVMAALGDLSGPELRATFNSGIGMAAVVEPDAVDQALGWLSERGLGAWRIGEVRPATELGAGRYAEDAA